MDIKKELSQNQIILAIVSGENYNQVILNTIKKLNNKRVCYITLNKTCESLKKKFNDKNIKTDNIIFIDAITRTITKTTPGLDYCYFVSSPASLTELSLAMTKFLSMGFDYVIFDSITNLLIYESQAPVAKFVSRIMNYIRTTKTKAIFYVLKGNEKEDMIKESEMFVDKVIELD